MFVFAASLCLLVATSANGNSLARVVGGGDADEMAYPYQVSIRVSGYHKCGGSLVGHRWILTAAHCLVKYNPLDITVVLGTNSLSSGGIAYSAEGVRVHPLYKTGGRYNDIGLIKTLGYIEYSNAVQPIGLPMKNVNEKDCVATFTGWGNTASSGVNHNELQVIELTVIDTQYCRSIFSTVGRGHLCTLTVVGEGVCYGDSGGPLVADGVQIAIASWGSPCARGYPDVHTRVYVHTQWIKSIID